MCNLTFGTLAKGIPMKSGTKLWIIMILTMSVNAVITGFVLQRLDVAKAFGILLILVAVESVAITKIVLRWDWKPVHPQNNV